MRKVVLLVAASMLLLTTVSMAQQTAPQTAPPTAPPNALGFIVEPGEVAPGPNAQLITGSITLKSSRLGSRSKTATTGGGCLIYTSVPNRTPPCTKDSECQIPGVGGYCANFDEGQAAKVCWHQPEPAQQSCHRSPTKALPLGKPVPFDKPTTPYPSGVQRPIRWRVVSCQNLVDGGCAKKDATDQDRKYRYTEKIKQFD